MELCRTSLINYVSKSIKILIFKGFNYLQPGLQITAVIYYKKRITLLGKKVETASQVFCTKQIVCQELRGVSNEVYIQLCSLFSILHVCLIWICFQNVCCFDDVVLRSEIETGNGMYTKLYTMWRVAEFKYG